MAGREFPQRLKSAIRPWVLASLSRKCKRTPVALPKLIDEVLAVYARKLQERGVAVHTRYKCGPCRPGCETCFIVSGGEMRQVFSNLLANGMDALRDHGQLYIRVSRVTNRDASGDNSHLTIADNGCGIRAENLNRFPEGSAAH
jgi:signal transduction histidine kinase